MRSRDDGAEGSDAGPDGERRERASDAGPAMVSWRLRLALAGIAAFLLLTGPLWAPLLLRRLEFFRLRRVEIIGAHFAAPSDILAALKVDTSVSIWDPTAPLAARVASHPEIRTVVLRRKLPGTLVVEVTERTPVALVSTPAGLRPYDERGVALPIDLTRVSVDAPVLLQRDLVLLHLLGAMRSGMPALYDRLSTLRSVGTDEVVLELRTVPVRAMKSVTLERLADIEPVENDLARRQLRVAEIDLRYRDQVIARLQ
jgi:cell division protein FtsQ